MLGVIISDANLGIKLKKLKSENLILCISREVFIGHHIYRDVPLKLLIHELLEKETEKKNFPFPEKPELVINRSCKLTDKLVTTKEIVDAVNWFFSKYGEIPVIKEFSLIEVLLDKEEHTEEFINWTKELKGQA